MKANKIVRYLGMASALVAAAVLAASGQTEVAAGVVAAAFSSMPE